MKRQRAEKAGRRAEWLAGLYLRARGYRIIARRYRCTAGEIDLIATRKRTVIFIEVKQRPDVIQAEESLTRAGLRRITAASETWYAKHPAFHSHGMRYDAVFIIQTGAFLPRAIIHRPDAWRG